MDLPILSPLHKRTGEVMAIKKQGMGLRVISRQLGMARWQLLAQPEELLRAGDEIGHYELPVDNDR